MSAPRPPTIQVAAETALILLLPLITCKALSLVPMKSMGFLRIYVSTLVAVGTATIALASLVRLRLVSRQAVYGFAACVVTILLITKRDVLTQPAAPYLRPQLFQFLVVVLVDISLLIAGWCVSQLFAHGVKRPSYLVIAAVAATISDMFSVSRYGFTRKVVEEHADVVASRAMLQWFVIGDRGVWPMMGVGDLLFLGLFLWGARRFEFPLVTNVVAQLLALAIAYAILLALTIPLPGMMFIGPVFLVVNWKRFDLQPAERRVVMGFGGGLIIAIVSWVLIVTTILPRPS